MKSYLKIIKAGCVFGLSAIMLLSSCNKEPEQIPGGPAAPAPTGVTLGATLAANADDSLYLAIVRRAGLLSLLNNQASTYTLFVPGNLAVKRFISAASGGLIPPGAPDAVFSAFIANSLPAASAAGIVSYNTVPQKVMAADIPSTFPNFQYPTILNPAPSVSALLRLTTFPSTANGAWINNVPLVGVDQLASNGVIHHTGALVLPPQRFVWDRINTDTELTYLKAAIIRADSGTVTTTSPGTLQGALLNIGANLTVFAPTDAAFRTTLTGAIYQVLVGLGLPPATALAQATALASTPAVFENPALYSVLTSQTVRGIVVYHVLGRRAFTNNFPTTQTFVPTLLNGAVPSHPGIGLTATFGTPFVSAATVKGAANATAANVIINISPLIPDPNGTSDQHYLNGVLHKIDQVLLPQ